MGFNKTVLLNIDWSILSLNYFLLNNMDANNIIIEASLSTHACNSLAQLGWRGADAATRGMLTKAYIKKPDLKTWNH